MYIADRCADCGWQPYKSALTSAPAKERVEELIDPGNTLALVSRERLETMIFSELLQLCA